MCVINRTHLSTFCLVPKIMNVIILMNFEILWSPALPWSHPVLHPIWVAITFRHSFTHLFSFRSVKDLECSQLLQCYKICGDCVGWVRLSLLCVGFMRAGVCYSSSGKPALRRLGDSAVWLDERLLRSRRFRWRVRVLSSLMRILFSRKLWISWTEL